MRVGHGYDVHKFIKGRQLVLGGVTVPYPFGLHGHSDADVLIHAVCDALLGAAGKRDIGYHFPDTSDEFLNIDSRILLRKVKDILDKEGYRVSNVDATVIAQKPKLKDYIEEMISNIAKDLEIEKTAVNVKATTEEGLGFTGELKGISAHAVCIIE